MPIIEFVPKKKEVKDNRNSDGGYYVAKCDECGGTFYPKRNNAKYCSTTCMRTAWWKKNKETVKKSKKPEKVAKKTKKTVVKAKKEIVGPKYTGYAYKRTLEHWILSNKTQVESGRKTQQDANTTITTLKNMVNGDTVTLKSGLIVHKENDYYYNN